MGSKIFLLHINIRKILVGGCGFFVKEDYEYDAMPWVFTCSGGGGYAVPA